MSDIYLFDWGDTLMVDLQGVPGKMCDWDTVEPVSGAFETLGYLSKRSAIYIATGAADSSEADIEKAFSRVNLSQFISGYFCQQTLGVLKGSPEFLPLIIQRLACTKDQVTLVGDSLVKDIEPAIAVGISAVLYNPRNNLVPDKSGLRVINELQELCGALTETSGRKQE